MAQPLNTIAPGDSKPDGRLLRSLPRGWRPYAMLMRLDRPIGAWLLLLPGWWSLALAAGPGQGGRMLRLMALFGLGAVVMRGAGCVVNDLWDRDLDGQVARTKSRPLAAGTVSVRQALILLAILLLIGSAVLAQLPRAAVLTGLASLPFVALYPAMKRITWWPQAFLGLTFNFGALIGWAAMRGQIEPPAMLLYAAGFCWTLGYDTIYAHQDLADDAAAGIKSSALWLGRWGKPFVGGSYLIAWGLLAAGFAAAGASLEAELFLIAPLLHLGGQLAAWRTGDAASALRIFRANRDFGLLVLLAACFAFKAG